MFWLYWSTAPPTQGRGRGARAHSERYGTLNGELWKSAHFWTTAWNKNDRHMVFFTEQIILWLKVSTFSISLYVERTFSSAPSTSQSRLNSILCQVNYIFFFEFCKHSEGINSISFLAINFFNFLLMTTVSIILKFYNLVCLGFRSPGNKKLCCVRAKNFSVLRLWLINCTELSEFLFGN